MAAGRGLTAALSSQFQSRSITGLRVSAGGRILFIPTGQNTSAFRFLKADPDSFIGAHRVPAKGGGESRLK
jgi:hypothetical protein